MIVDRAAARATDDWPLSPVSASSFLRDAQHGPARQFTFRFRIHEPSGTLTLVPDDDDGLLEAVRGAIHREPEAHLAASVGLLNSAQSLGRSDFTSVWGLSEKDRSLVDLLAREYEQVIEAGILMPGAHTLEVQDAVTRSPTRLRPAVGGEVRVLVVRHLLEHARHLDAFLGGLRELLAPDDLCFIEVPDSRGLLVDGDLTQLWEEHTAYFTGNSLRAVLLRAGFDVLAEQSLISEGEELCLAVVRRATMPHKSDTSQEVAIAERFLQRLQAQLVELSTGLRERAQQRRIVVFGANHMAGLFLDLTADTASNVHAILDDDPTKWGKALGILDTPVSNPGSISGERPLHVLVAVNEGRSPRLYERLRTHYPETEGHRIESLVSLYRECWEKAR